MLKNRTSSSTSKFCFSSGSEDSRCYRPTLLHGELDLRGRIRKICFVMLDVDLSIRSDDYVLVDMDPFQQGGMAPCEICKVPLMEDRRHLRYRQLIHFYSIRFLDVAVSRHDRDGIVHLV